MWFSGILWIQDFQPNMSHKMLSFLDFTLYWYYFSIVALFSIMEPKDQAIPITLCKSRNISLWIPSPSFRKSLIWVVGVEMSKKRLSTFYMLQNLEGSLYPVCLVLCLEVQLVFSPRASEDCRSFCKRNYTDHWLDLKGFPPVWVRLCSFTWEALVLE